MRGGREYIVYMVNKWAAADKEYIVYTYMVDNWQWFVDIYLRQPYLACIKTFLSMGIFIWTTKIKTL